MKDIGTPEQWGKSIIKYILFISFIISYSQENKERFLMENEYSFLNDIFSNESSSKILLYNKTYFDKEWIRYFSRAGLKSIKDNVGLGTSIKDNELDSLLKDEVLFKIRNSIISSKPIKLKKSKLIDKIKLVKSFDEDMDIKTGVLRISRPIIIGDIAVIKLIQFSSSNNHIYVFRENKWDLVYSFYDWLILR
jgi:hypothetical protein